MFTAILFACAFTPATTLDCRAFVATSDKPLLSLEQCDAYVKAWGKTIEQRDTGKTLAHLSGWCIPAAGTKI